MVMVKRAIDACSSHFRPAARHIAIIARRMCARQLPKLSLASVSAAWLAKQSIRHVLCEHARPLGITRQ